MKIKIKDTIYNASEEPIMVILTKKDKENIANMLPEATKYAGAPDTFGEQELKEWMKT